MVVDRLGCRRVADTLLQQGSLQMMVQGALLIPENVGGHPLSRRREQSTAAELIAQRWQ